MQSRLKSLKNSAEAHLYEIGDSNCDTVKQFIASTAESRRICNDSLCVGLEYTQMLSAACRQTLSLIRPELQFELNEHHSVVLNILRGGLNFGIREALGGAFGWNCHGSAFISAQRARKGENSNEWLITESSYQKVYIPQNATLIFGDVVATGTSLEHAIDTVLSIIENSGGSLSGILFFTIGGTRSSEILFAADSRCRAKFPNYKGSAVVYFEGQFSVASNETPIEIKIDGTDLLRRDCLLAPEFIESQFENPAYPIERCTIYDAGSRAFRVEEYLKDVVDYWEKTLELSKQGITFEKLLASRFPELAIERFGHLTLQAICIERLLKAKSILGGNN